jgi:hypothetical protein
MNFVRRPDIDATNVTVTGVDRFAEATGCCRTVSR